MNWRFWERPEPNDDWRDVADRWRQMAADWEQQYGRMHDTFNRLHAIHERSIVASEARYAELLTRYHQLRLQGHVPVEIPEAAPAKPVDPVIAAVNRACRGKDAAVRTAMLRQVQADRGADVPDEEIIRRINTGHRPMDEMDDSQVPQNPERAVS